MKFVTSRVEKFLAIPRLVDVPAKRRILSCILVRELAPTSTMRIIRKFYVIELIAMTTSNKVYTDDDYDDDVHNKVQNSLCKTNLTLLEMQKNARPTYLGASFLGRIRK